MLILVEGMKYIICQFGEMLKGLNKKCLFIIEQFESITNKTANILRSLRARGKCFTFLKFRWQICSNLKLNKNDDI